MRVGFNPLKHENAFSTSSSLTIATVTYMPCLEGYWQEALDVLRVCIDSLRTNTGEPFDLMVFDNGSCREVREHLLQRQQAGEIQHLFLSEKNVGKVGALNMMFGAAQSELLAFTDSDVYFYPGWLEAERRVLEAFPDVGMVSGVPTAQNFGKFTTSTLKRAAEDPDVRIETGALVPEEWTRRYAASLGKTNPDSFVEKHGRQGHTKLTRNGVSAYATATHFQFLAKTEVLRSIVPLPVTMAVGAEWVMDEALDQGGFQRLTVDGYVVHHLGNVLTDEWREQTGERVKKSNAAGVAGPSGFWKRATRRMARMRTVRRLAQAMYRQSFKILSAAQ